MSATKYTIPQQSLNLLRQCLNLSGWAKTPVEFYTAGRLLSELPELNLDWVKSEVEVSILSREDRLSYSQFNRDFCSLMVEINLTIKEVSLIRACLEANLSRLSPDKYTHELCKVFSVGTE